MNKLIFTLQQHTPLIHFQPDQQGATLRASEVKPKLDRFIIEKLGGTEVRKQHPEWFISKESDALNYKLSFSDKDIRPFSERSIVNPKLISENVIDKKGITSNDLKVTIFSYKIPLIEIIKGLLPDFFLLTNFGTRQTKGWGSFYHENTKNWDQVKYTLLSCNLPVYVYNKDIDIENIETNIKIFYTTVTKKWRELKSGVNITGNYKKSLLFKYLCTNHIRWDKRWMKKRLIEMIDRNDLPAGLLGTKEPNDCCVGELPCDNTVSKNSLDDDLNFEYRFGRAMLGLPEHIEFRAKNNYIYQVIVNNSNGIERYSSPVIFKIFGNKLFAIAHQPTEFFNKEFYFEVQKKKTPAGGGKPQIEDDPIKILNDDGNPYTLKTPLDISEFNIEIFLNNYFTCIGFKRLTNDNIINL